MYRKKLFKLSFKNKKSGVEGDGQSLKLSQSAGSVEYADCISAEG